MNKKAKILICLFFIFICFLFFQYSLAKYVLECSEIVAKINIDRCKPIIELVDITTSNINYPTYANKTHIVSGHIKLKEKNIVTNNLNKENVKILVNNSIVSVNFTKFQLITDNTNEKIYEFSFSNTLGDGPLSINIPKGLVVDKSDLVNDAITFSTNITIDNTVPVGTFKEIPNSNKQSTAEITCSEAIRPILGWNNSNNVLTKVFSNYITYELPIVDLAQNSSNVLVDIKNASKISLKYGTYDEYSNFTLVSGGQISSPNTISSNSICKTESIFTQLSGDMDSSSLLGKCYVYTYWGNGSYRICSFSENSYYHGYNPTNPSEWITSKNNTVFYHGTSFIQLGGVGMNVANSTASNVKTPLPSDIAKKYLYGISGIQFRLVDDSEYSVVYQVYVKGVGWLKPCYNGAETFFDHTKPISGFRMNIVPNSERQYLIDYWLKI